MLASVAQKLFVQSDPARQVGGKPLGLLAENILLYLTGLPEDSGAMALLENPMLHAYGSIEQSYLDLLKVAKSSKYVGPLGQWPLLIRSMTIPLSDDLFISREADVTALGASRIGKLVKDELQEQTIGLT